MASFAPLLPAKMASASFNPSGVAAAFHPVEDERPLYSQSDLAPYLDPQSFLNSLTSLPSHPFSSSSSSSSSLPTSCSSASALVPTLGGHEGAASSYLLEEDDAVANFDLGYHDDGLGDFLSFPAAPLFDKQYPSLEVKCEPLHPFAAEDADTFKFLDDCLTEELRELPQASPSPSGVSLAPSPTVSAYPSRAGSPSPSSTPSPSATASPALYFEGQFTTQPSRKRPRVPKGQAENPIPALPPRKRKVGEVMPEDEKKERNKVAAQKYRQKLRSCAEETEVACRRLQLENTELACQIKMERENIERLKQTLIKYGVIPAPALSCQ